MTGQPQSFSFTPENADAAKRIIAKYPKGRQQSAVLPLLDLAQRQHDGWLPRAAMDHVAAVLGMAPIRVYEVATFYTMFNLKPVGRHHVQVCTTTPCWLRGSDEVMAACRKRGGARADDRRRPVHVFRGRVPGGVRECADGADRRRLLRGPGCTIHDPHPE